MKIIKIKTPVSEQKIREIKVNDVLYLTGTIVTARDQAHKRALEYLKSGKNLPINLEGGALFHCGPVIIRRKGEWKIVAAGPTTSTRMERYESELIRNSRLRLVIGKGGMGERTTEAMKNYGAVYGAFTGGGAVLAAQSIKKVKEVQWLDLGTPEALWVFEVQEFGPITVAIDSYGNNLFLDIQKSVHEKKAKIYKKIGI